jgi:purine-binding chemotaxis protein CheW
MERIQLGPLEISPVPNIPTLVDEVAVDERYLVCRSGSLSCAVPLRRVVETMRPQPVVALQGQPAFLLGVATIRGAAVPVVDLARMTGSSGQRLPARFVTLDLNGRCVALAVDDVLGVRQLRESVLGALPPLLSDLEESAVSSVATLDEGLLLVLHAARLLTDAAWVAIEAGQGAS